MNKKTGKLLGTALFASFLLAACGDTEEANVESEAQPAEQMEEEDGHSGHNMNHSGSGQVPEGLEEAADPAYPVGSTAIIQHGHMDGMEGAEAKIVGAYDTTVYTVSYTPANGGDPVEDHKWVIHEEIEDAGDKPFAAGDEVTLAADHMEGMKGAPAMIDSAVDTTVYMIDFTTTDGEEVTNHKWVTEDELTAE
ncbi:YdhK family protein [Domibacillus sp. PGB-M46]|uniref:YdhK family protein n=1 Tax=Domibacillus sp. PGB-M46 TaxID=2910255 RepID=UPI001F57E89E|nr:YdhK family protein [Domibacillus sp. PGB-M46]MCI2256595.1 YdhK family protein [Domibacillus sp. PGB-M46]